MRARTIARASAALFVVTATLGAAPAAHAVPAHSSGDGPAVPVIVEAADAAAARDAVVAAGGTVGLDLSIVGGVSAVVDPAALATLQSDPSVEVTPDATLHATSGSFGAASSSSPPAPGLDPQLRAIGVGSDSSPDAGRGISVALVDTGVADTPDLHGSRLVRAPDFSGEGDGIDHYGHGTFMAGLIAGDGSASAGAPVHHVGVAPGATVVSVKVSGRDGSTTVARVIAGIGWVVTHVDQYHIGVLNLSFGVDAPMPYTFNPLSAAVEAAWASGITVVVSAGNNGSQVTSPGSDPYVLTVGAANTAGTASTSDDFVPAWSGQEVFRHYSKPNVAAPGVSVISLRAPGSTVDKSYPSGRVGTAYFRGSGTSMSTALVSGAAAVLLSHHPLATPDDIKGAFVDGAVTITGGREINIGRADHATPSPDWNQHYPVAFKGLGRGLHNGMPWTASRWTASRWTASRWTTSRWTASRWTWTASRWTASRWTSSRWTSSRWTSSRWTSSRWTSSRWTAEAWPSQGWG
jgi:serine protease AprX